MLEQKKDAKRSGRKPTESTTTVPDEVLLAMLEEVLAKLRAAGWAIAKCNNGLLGKEDVRAILTIYITGKPEKNKPKIGVNNDKIITLDGVPVTEMRK